MNTQTSDQTYVIASLLGAVIPFFAIIWMTMGETGGAWEYPLDDPYIHLAMSEQIAVGGYGVNAGEYASASSSILFPFLLAPFSDFSWHWLTPLLWGGVGLIAAAGLWGKLVGEIALGANQSVKTYLVVIAAIGPLFLHLVGVSLSGMEHILQVLAAMMVAYGLIKYCEDGSIHWYLIAGIILNPLLRFEGLAVSCFACGVLLFSGRQKISVMLGLFALLPVGIYFLIMSRIGLNPLPNSVMAKGAIVGGDPYFRSEIDRTKFETILNSIEASLSASPGYPLLFLALFWIVAAVIWRKILGWKRTLLALSVAALAISHLLLGTITLFYRYEVYAWAYGLTVSVYLLSTVWTMNAVRAKLIPIALLFGVVFGGRHYPLQTFFIYPDAGAAISVQQKQMGRFVDDFVQGPVAVNDLGHVSYQNPHHVLDLWGLASKEALDTRLSERNPYWADDLISRYDVGVIMIYDWWFEGRTNPNWIKVAEMTITRSRGALGGSIVAFYAVDETHELKLRSDLEAFAPTLPEGTRLDFIG